MFSKVKKRELPDYKDLDLIGNSSLGLLSNLLLTMVKSSQLPRKL